MPTKHIENHTNAPMYVGGKMIPPGSGRDINVALLPPEHQVHAAVVDQSGPSVAELIESLRAQPVKDILADLEGLTQEALGLLHEAEKAQPKPRTSLIAGLEAEAMRRADARIKAEEDALYLNQLLDLTPDQLAAIGEKIGELTPAQLGSLTGEQRARMKPELLAALSPEQLSALDGTPTE